MRFISRFSFAVALAATGAVVFAMSPQEAYAAKKEKAPSVKISDAIKPQVIEIQKNLKDNPAAAKPIVEALLAQQLTGDDQFIAGQLALQIGGALKDAPLQEKGINASLASGKVSAEQAPLFNFYSGNFAYGAGRYSEAQQKLKQAIDLGYNENGVGALLAEAYFKENKYQQGLDALKIAIERQKSSGAVVEQDWYRRGAALAMQSKLPGAAGDWTYKLVEAYPTGENWRAALSVYRDSATPSLDNQQNLELMRLMRKANAMVSERDYFEYADAADPRRLPGEVVSVLEEGLASGNIPATSAYVKEALGLARGAVSADKASLAASERDAMKSPNGKIALATADAILGYDDYAKAASLYQTAIEKGGIDNDRANMGLAIAKVGQQDWAGAKQAFASINGTRKPVARFWTLWLEQKTKAPAAS